jgi:nucleotide-binding universal stress UspA family protein
VKIDMIEFNRILCPIDFSESSVRSLAHAAVLANWYESQLTVLHVVPTFDPVQVRGDLGEPIQVVAPMSQEQVLHELRRALEGTKAPESTAVVAAAGDAPTTITDQALSTGADLIVMGTHGRRGFKRLLLGSVAETVLHEAPCPVLTVPPRAGVAGSETVMFKRILCPVDFSAATDQALGFALDLVRQADGRLTLLHVLEWLAEDEPRMLAHFNVAEYRRALAADARERLRALVAEEPRTWAEIETVLAFGRAHREIIRAAEANSADLIVMGAQGRGGVDLALFGSTTQQVVRSASCPVLTVRGVRQA